MRRVLTDVFNKEVVYVVNITDVDDKILERSKKLAVDPAELTRKSEIDFFKDMEKLGNLRPTIVPRATQYIDEMLEFIGRLRKYSYRTEDGSIYLDTKKAQGEIEYPSGLGVGRDISEGHNSSGEDMKRNSADFALWKSRTVGEESLAWSAEPYGGVGRPGWHLECSAMIDSTIGRVRGDGRLDIHGGGIDLCFPHHANERCQSQLVLDDRSKEWATVFCHTGHVMVNSDKMSKSLGNFTTIRDILNQDTLSPRQLRLVFLSSSRYSSQMEWNSGVVEKALALDKDLEQCLRQEKRTAHGRDELHKEFLSAQDIAFIHRLQEARDIVVNALGDNFDFPRVFDELHKICKDLRRRQTNVPQSAPQLDNQGRKFVEQTLNALGFQNELRYHDKSSCETSSGDTSKKLEQALQELVEFRTKIRQAAKSGDMRNVYKECDLLRDSSNLITIQDLKNGLSSWKLK